MGVEECHTPGFHVKVPASRPMILVLARQRRRTKKDVHYSGISLEAAYTGLHALDPPVLADLIGKDTAIPAKLHDRRGQKFGAGCWIGALKRIDPI